MAYPKLSRLELQIMETLWNRGPCSIREIQEAFPESKRPAYTTVQTTVYRMLEGKKTVKIVRRISNANIFDAAITRDDAGKKLIDELLALFGGRTKPVMANLVESGRLTLEDVKEAEEAIRKLARPKKSVPKPLEQDKEP
ncbi:MAG TPA: BlaI/MecI/CopY family transcriptional regulator [Bryobacteraceae bacterium]|jgi:predicted transcriptional regulator|nr:BlaI/MecI/CopY family transcriptional regulator [Bryobacteraceae bacterium]